jgi:xylose isomerase
MGPVLLQGNAPPGGINLKLSPRRDGDLRDLLTLYVKYIDAAAKGLRFAASIVSEQTFSKHLQVFTHNNSPALFKELQRES